MDGAVDVVARTNDRWVEDLTSEGVRQDAAIAKLREYLRRGLYAYLRDQRSDTASTASTDLQQMTEDFVQEALLKTLESLTSFRGESRFLTWAMKIAIRTAVSNLRRAAYRDVSLDDLEARGATLRLLPESRVQPSKQPDPQKEAERREVLTSLREAVEGDLSEKQRIAFVSAEIEGVPIEVVARLMGSNPNAVYKVVHDARKKLRAALASRGYTYEGVAPLFAGGG